jgi:predicted nuclease with RNAse H fold
MEWRLVMKPIYMGVDIAGAQNTWACGISTSTDNLEICLPPAIYTLSQIVNYAEDNSVCAVAIDAQLTCSIEEENGVRSSDLQLKAMLPLDCKSWVASQNSLAAVPTRGRQLSEALGPVIGTIIETHPRACLYLADPAGNLSATKYYKKPNYDYFLRELFTWWLEHFKFRWDSIRFSEGSLDAIVCATVAYLYHHDFDKLIRLDHTATNKTGRGPFYVIKPGAFST